MSWRVRRAVGVSTVAALSVTLALAPTVGASPNTISPIADRSPTGVTADALPTVQIDGVVWSQAVVGNTVYAGGSFTNARPAGAPDGTQLIPRSNLLAYNLSTGALITSFDHVVNGTIKTVVASPDGTRVYIGGQFTSVDGQNRYRIAAFDTATGALLSFDPGVDASVNSLSVTNSVVYAGGVFSEANGSNSRSRLAAFSLDGALLGWAPTADSTVNAVLATPDGTHVIVGGAFATLNGAPALGLGSLDAQTGELVPFAVNQVVKDYGPKSAILSLSTDGSAIYGTGYTFGSGNFEGTFSADPITGAINWLEDCHGDTYGAYASGGQVYVVSHEHYCANLGGFSETPIRSYHRTTAFTTQATGTLTYDVKFSYANFTGKPSPSLVNWFPELTTGTYTKQIQAAWTVTGNGKYVVEGGEFLDVNGTPQQGLVRFAVPSAAPSKRGPMDSTSVTTATVASKTSATITWPSNWDEDNDVLTYRLMRSGITTPVYTTTAVSQFWNRPSLSFTDSGLQPGTTYNYTVVVSDPDGNTVSMPPVAVNTTGIPQPPPPAPTTTSVTPSTSAPVVGQAITADVSVSRTDNSTPAPGNVAVTIDGGAAQTLPLTSGHAQVSTQFGTIGTHTIAASYQGSASLVASSSSATLTVAPDSTSTKATVSPAKPVAGQPLSVSSSVATVAPGTAAATGSVTVSVDGNQVGSTALTGSVATTPVAGLVAGPHTITVRYSGDSTHTASSSTVPVTVAPDSTSTAATVSPAKPVTGQRLSVRSTVAPVAPGTLAATGSVTVSVDGRSQKPTTLSNAAATTTLAGLPAGRHTISVRYGGDAGHSASTYSRTITVAAGRTAARVTSSAPRTSTRTLVHFHAYVTAVASATGRPGGSVIFYIDGHRYATRTLHSGTATYSVRLRKGRHTVKVVYAGSNSYRSSTSRSITQTER